MMLKPTTTEGLFILNKTTGEIKALSNNNSLLKNVRGILKSKSNHMWFTSDNGLYRLNLSTEELKVFNTENGLPDNSVMCVEEDGNHVIWVGTKNGLAYFDGAGFKPVKLANNFGANTITFIKADLNNAIWVGTNYGVYKLKKEQNGDGKIISKHYSNFDGLKSLECNQNAVYIDHNNHLWFGTSKGLMEYDLSITDQKVTVPKTHIIGLRLFFEQSDFSSYSDSINQQTGLPINLVLDYNKNHVTFDYVGINFRNSDKVKYQFKLEGFDEDWSPSTSANFVTYSNIPNGQFTFWLKATIDGINWSEPIRYDFTINPPFWLRWWFYLLIGCFVFSIVWLFIMRRKKIEQGKRETQRIIDRSKMLALEHQTLNASMNRHFIFNALNSIQYYINRQDKLSANKYLSSFAKLIRKNLDSSLVNEVYIDEEIERIALYLSLEQMRFQNKFTYEINVDEEINEQTIRIPSMLLQPFIENSIWHGILPLNKEGHIQVNVNYSDGRIVIDIIDNGIGIEESMEKKRDKRQHHISKGMELTKGRVELISRMTEKECFIEGPQQVNDDQGKGIGTRVSIVISL